MSVPSVKHLFEDCIAILLIDNQPVQTTVVLLTIL
jgi:hypothetical protein